MDTSELGRALRDATADLEPRPGFTTAVVRGGQRRKFRVRAMIATGMAAATAAVAGTGTYLIWLDPPPGTEAAHDPRLTQPTKGDLRDDRAFLNAAVTAWREGLHRSWNADRGIFDDLRGQPYVYWAGTTPAGPAAVVMQRAYLHPHGNLSPDQFNTEQTLYGLVAKDPTDGVLKLVYDQYTPSGFPEAGYFQFGPGDRTVLVVDRGTPLFYSAAPRLDPDGKLLRDWQPMPVLDGVAIAQTPEGGNPAAMRVLARATPPAPNDKANDGRLRLEPSSRYLGFAKTGTLPREVTHPVDHRLQWSDGAARLMRAGRAYDKVPANPQNVWRAEVEKAGMTDSGTNMWGIGLWNIVAGLDDGQAVLVSELQEDSNPSRIFGVLLDSAGKPIGAFAGDQVDRTIPLPVRLRIPDGRGWVVADYGATLRYRVGSGAPWQNAGQNAALLPDAATEVEVTRNGAATEITLPR